ncbi:MmcQ/YjbR family DNA-binding protein [Pseudonocardia alni]|uniref:MmcQ/YjbR family DNA-binding protein n=1 Tax=Pseudonocardia alni TaxID=33907 RepID=UPI00370D4024
MTARHPDPADPLPWLREICLSLPEVTEKQSHGSPSWFVRRMFVSYAGNHHGHPHLAFWCAAAPGVQAELVAEDPARFFRPAYVGHRGWLGVVLDGTGDAAADRDEITEIVTDAWRCVAPARPAGRPARQLTQGAAPDPRTDRSSEVSSRAWSASAWLGSRRSSATAPATRRPGRAGRSSSRARPAGRRRERPAPRHADTALRGRPGRPRPGSARPRARRRPTRRCRATDTVTGRAADGPATTPVPASRHPTMITGCGG